MKALLCSIMMLVLFTGGIITQAQEPSVGFREKVTVLHREFTPPSKTSGDELCGYFFLTFFGQKKTLDNGQVTFSYLDPSDKRGTAIAWLKDIKVTTDPNTPVPYAIRTTPDDSSWVIHLGVDQKDETRCLTVHK